MACVDVDLCDKIDLLNTNLEYIYYENQVINQNTANLAGKLYEVMTAQYTILGFLAVFLFCIIMKFFLNFFNKLF